MDENVLPPGVSAGRRPRGWNSRAGPDTPLVFRRERVMRVGLDGKPSADGLGEPPLSSDGRVVA